jgi:hypothetical protein
MAALALSRHAKSLQFQDTACPLPFFFFYSRAFYAFAAMLVLLSMPACLDTLATWELSERLSHVHLVRKQNPRDAPTWTSRHRRGTRLHHALPWAVRPCPSPHSHWPSQRWSIAARPVVLVSFPTWTTSSRFLPLPPPPRCSHLNCNCSSKLHRSAQPPPFFSCLPPL